MDKNKILKFGGVAAIIVGTAALFLSGTSESTVIELVAGVFILAGIVSVVIKDKVE